MISVYLFWRHMDEQDYRAAQFDENVWKQKSG